MISLGCDKNLADSEEMLGILREAGFVLTDDLKEADACVVNTCGFIKDAKEESITTICDLLPYKTQGKLRYILVTGCLAERYFADFSTEFPEVDAILGTNAYDKIAEALLTLSRQEKREVYAFRRDFQTLCKTDTLRSQRGATNTAPIVRSLPCAADIGLFLWKNWLRRQDALHRKVSRN